MNENSMLHWYPKVSGLGVPVPETYMCHMELQTIIRAARIVGFPCFLRTDLASGKHDWKDSCFVPDEASLPSHMAKILEANVRWQMLGIEPQAFVVREFLPLQTLFNAFSGSMPINKERRYFVKDGQVLCSHPYWETTAFNNYPARMAEGDDWKEKLAILNQRNSAEIFILDRHASTIGAAIGGEWSIDFAQDIHGKWWMLDMALAYNSYHQAHTEDR